MGRIDRLAIDTELELLTSQLLTLGRKEESFQSAIDAIQKLKDDVAKEIMALERRRNTLEAEKESINWLPPELLIEIFEAFTELDCHTPGYRPALAISHTCTKWRNIILSTPHLWTRLHLHGFRKPESLLAQLYLERSGSAPLQIEFYTPPDTMPTQESLQTAELLVQSRPHLGRVKSLLLQTRSALSLIYFLLPLRNHMNTLPQLRNLTLGIQTPDPTFLEAPEFLEREATTLAELRADMSLGKAIRTASPLLHLKLEQLPLFSIPITFISNLRSLELTYSPRKRNCRHHYSLKMSTLCQFLALTPLLEELILANTVPNFDIILPSDGPATVSTGPPLIETQPVKLDHLKSVDWTYPSARDVHLFFSAIIAPELEKLDLWVEDNRAEKRIDPLATDSVIVQPPTYIPGAITHPSLRDLTLQCDEDTTTTVLRKMAVPALQKVEFTSFSATARNRTEDAIRSHLPLFPRLESIFRDPRLLNLTHLTLSHYKISSEPGSVEALLGYMPVLTSLSLDSCSGLRRLLRGLQETFVGVGNVGGGMGGRSRRGVKVCPRLDTLSFWDCHDVDCASLRAVILSRNRSIGNFEEDFILNGEGTPNGASEAVTREAVDANEGDSHRTREAQMGRKIKPLRKLRCHRHDLGGISDTGTTAVSSTIASTIVAIEEAFQPAQISFLRVDNCKLMGNEEEVLAFRDVGVVDVIWAGSG